MVSGEESIEEKFEKAIKPRLTIEESDQEQQDIDEQDLEEDGLVAEGEDLTAEEGSGLFSEPVGDNIIDVSQGYICLLEGKNQKGKFRREN